MLVDVNSPLSGQSLDRSAPWTTYDLDYMTRVFGVIEAFKDYPNTLLFFAGNEIINDVQTGQDNPPYIRAVTRDMRSYIAKNSARSIPVGYSAADVRSVLVDTFNYLQCTLTPDSPTTDPSRSDIFALNSYSWCGDATYTSSGYNVLTGFFEKTSVPVFFSEYGCNQVLPREFTEVQAIYGPQMSPVMSGGLVFEYVQEANDYGLVVINSNGSAQLRDDFDALQKQYNLLNSTELQSSKPLNTTNIPPTCNSSLISSDGFATNFTLPSMPSGVETLIESGLTKPNNGKLVDVTDTTVSQVVMGSSGNVIRGLAITPLANGTSNTPSGDNSSETTGTASGSATRASMTASATATNKSAGVLVEVKTWFVASMGLAALVACLWTSSGFLEWEVQLWLSEATYYHHHNRERGNAGHALMSERVFIAWIA